MNVAAVACGGLLLPRPAAAAARHPPDHGAAPAPEAFARPERVVIESHEGGAMEPFMSRGGRWLLFNNLNETPQDTNQRSPNASTTPASAAGAGRERDGPSTVCPGARSAPTGRRHNSSTASFPTPPPPRPRGGSALRASSAWPTARASWPMSTPKTLGHAACISADGLTWYFTRAPHSRSGFAEAPALSPDERPLYFQRKDGGRIALYRATQR